ncbi:MAG: hypothetical protein H7A25_12265 [Leptospiraceae bacterium]|nr:hypothetical protein [Leptospiraceae bacterium]MCP5500674.1 hypothetical protein [Leptospiraceae bacterium]
MKKIIIFLAIIGISFLSIACSEKPQETKTDEVKTTENKASESKTEITEDNALDEADKLIKELDDI